MRTCGIKPPVSQQLAYLCKKHLARGQAGLPKVSPHSSHALPHSLSRRVIRWRCTLPPSQALAAPSRSLLHVSSLVPRPHSRRESDFTGPISRLSLPPIKAPVENPGLWPQGRAGRKDRACTSLHHPLQCGPVQGLPGDSHVQSQDPIQSSRLSKRNLRPREDQGLP